MIVIEFILVLTAILIVIVVLRQLFLSVAFLFTSPRARREWSDDIVPTVAILIPAHNEEKVIDGCLAAMRRIDYPRDKIRITVINDRSHDKTGPIADYHASQDNRITVIHRTSGMQPGKPAALAGAIDAMSENVDVFVFFDADYLPPPRLIKQLVVPFGDPEVGASMGRVVPYNTDTNLLTKLIDLERRGGYVVDQEMRHRFRFLPQFAGTCGAVRSSALKKIGGWNTRTLTEDTDLTYRLFIAGFRVEYVVDATCYEESPEDWSVRFRQVRRWAYGHNECMFRYFIPVLRATGRPFWARIDAAIVLLLFLIPAFSVLSLVLLIMAPALGVIAAAPLAATVSFLSLSAVGNFSLYFQLAVGSLQDRQAVATRSMPLVFFSSFISMIAALSGLLQLLRDKVLGFTPHWDKTKRFRRSSSLPIGADEG
jgi:cellulose synthase/poly-beta-1,6-N-acetylglucosamine synthase-like glycosyltransferase